MKIKRIHSGTWSTTETTYDIDDDEVIGLLKRVILELREEDARRLVEAINAGIKKELNKHE
jgi:hypothetical protein